MVTESITGIAALEPPFDADVADLLGRMMPEGVPPIGLFRVLARNLPMTRALHAWGRYELGPDLSVPLRDREIVIDRVAARCGCEYEWGVHLAWFAGRAGLDGDQVRSLTVGSADDACWTDERDRLLVRVVDALHDTGDLPDALARALAVHYSPEQVLDLLLLAGWYHAVSYAANVARVPREPGFPRFADHR
jgi:alkylhydroperoxidase family enzyme